MLKGKYFYKFIHMIVPRISQIFCHRQDFVITNVCKHKFNNCKIKRYSQS